MSTTTPLPTWTLGELMEKARRDANVSTAEMASYLGVNPKTINNYEANRTHPSRSTIMAWAAKCEQPWFTVEGIRDLLATSLRWVTTLPGQLSFASLLFTDLSPVDAPPAIAA